MEGWRGTFGTAKVRHRRLVRRTIKLAFLGLFLWCIYAGFRAVSGWIVGLVKVEGVEVKGARTVDPKEVVERCGVRPGDGLYKVDVREVVGRVKGITWVREVEVRRSPFGKFILKIEERKPVALLVAGRLFPVDADGVVLSPLKVPPDLPLITGVPKEVIKIGKRIDYPPAERALRWICGVREVEPGLLDEISEVKAGEGRLTAYLTDGTEVVLGGRPKKDASYLSAVLQRLSQEGRKAKVLDLRFSCQVVARF